MNRYVALQIVLAQIASDAGKGFVDLVMKDRSSQAFAVKNAYKVKDSFILRAISAILRDKKSGFTFYFQDEPEGGFTSGIIYFNFKIDGIRKQISFHTRAGHLYKRYNKDGKNCETHWNGIRFGSSEAAELLIKKFGF